MARESLAPTRRSAPFGWVPPVYWFADTARGGAFGFASEMGPGAAIPSVETLERTLAPDELEALWKRPDEPQYHAGTSPPSNSLADFHFALTHRHGAPGSLEDYVAKAQLSHYETERAMYEAFGRNKYAPATGVIQWMRNSAWPSLHWNLEERRRARARSCARPSGRTMTSRSLRESGASSVRSIRPKA